MEPSPIPPSAPAPLPVRRSRATLVNIVGWPAASLLAVGYLALLARLTSFPFEDLPDHLARAKVLADLLFHHGARWGSLFAFHWQPVPYLLHDLILTSLVATLGTAAGGVIFTQLIVLALPCALLYYAHVNKVAPQARPLIVLVSLYLATDWFFLVGFAAFRLGVALFVACLALADALRERWSPRLYCVYLAALLAGYFDHLTVIVFLAAALTVSGSVRALSGRSNSHAEIRLALPVLLLLLLYFAVFAGPPHASSPGIYSFNWGSAAQKIQGLQDELYRFGGRVNRPMTALLAFCLLWPVRRELVSRRLLAAPVLERLALAVTFLAIYLVLPATYSGAAYVDVRALPFIVLFILFAMLLLDGGMREAGSGFAGAPALAAAVVLAAVNLAYVGWHLENDNAWMERYRAVVAQIPRGALVLPVFTAPAVTTLPLTHASAFVLLDRDGVTPYLFAGDAGDPMSYFRYVSRPYAPAEAWYRLQRIWDAAPVFTFNSQGQTYRWRFGYDPLERDWRPAVLAPVSWGAVACEYSYIIATEPYDPAFIGVPTRTLAANSSAALLAVDRGACHLERGAASGETQSAPQRTY